jgi:hypothetical protein
MGLKATPQRIKCMILIRNPLGGNLVATIIFSIHMCFSGASNLLNVQIQNKLVQ